MQEPEPRIPMLPPARIVPEESLPTSTRLSFVVVSLSRKVAKGLSGTNATGDLYLDDDQGEVPLRCSC